MVGLGQPQEGANRWPDVNELVTSMTAGVIVQDEDGDIVEWNPAALEILSLTNEEMLGRKGALVDASWDLIRDDRTSVSSDDLPVQRALRGGEGLRNVLLGVLDGRGSRKWLTVSTSAFVGADGRRLVASTFIDNTDRVEYRRAMRSIERFHSGIGRDARIDELFSYATSSIVEGQGAALSWVAQKSAQNPGGVDMVSCSGQVDYLYDGIISWWGSDESGNGPVGRALRTRKIQISDDLTFDATFAMWRERAERFGLRSLCALPFQIDESDYALAVYSRDIAAFNHSTVEGLTQFCDHLAVSAQSCMEALRRQRALDGTLGALGDMTDAYDPYTAGHQSQVGRIAQFMAVKLGLAPGEVRAIAQGAEVHDIGKISIPQSILVKPRRLTSIEYALIQQHPRTGYDILRGTGLSEPILDVVLHHHERLDGSGYPDGLGGDEVSIHSRIVAVADVYEAMTSHRPYRAGLGSESALEELRGGRGSRFDADAVDALGEVLVDVASLERGAQ